MIHLILISSLASNYHLLDTTSFLLKQTHEPRYVTAPVDPIFVIHKHACIRGQGLIADLENLACTQFKNGDCLCVNVGSSFNNVGQVLQTTISNPPTAFSNLFSTGSLNIKFTF